MAMAIRKGDTVEVITGDDKGTRGEVIKVDPTTMTVIVQGVRRVHKHVKPSRRNPQGGRLSVEMPLDISNVMLVYGEKPTRVKFGTNDKGQKCRMTPDGKVIDVVVKKNK